MRIKNGYEKLAEMLGVEFGKPFKLLGNEFELDNPYTIDATGIYDRDGDYRIYTIHDMLLGRLSIEICPLLTKEERSYLHNLRMICGNIETIELIKDNDKVGRTVMYCVDDCEVCVAEVVVAPGLFDELELDREYTWEELGLED